VVPFQALLKKLVSKVEGAEGAIFLDREGEAVQWHARSDAERLRLRAAYLAVVLRCCRASADALALGRIRYLLIDYEGARLVAEEVEGGYFVVIELSNSANLGQALYRMGPAVEDLRREIGV
jgi:predicted regulator of Ras-like GTPase activity (Roadblock/LC7/MglB family)